LQDQIWKATLKVISFIHI